MALLRQPRSPQALACDASHFLDTLALCVQYRNYIYKLNNSKIRITFHSTTDLMKFQMTALNFQIYKCLFSQFASAGSAASR